MNKVHSIVWSKAQNAWVVVAEGTKAVSKAGGAGLKVLIALIMLSPVAGNAATLPSGGTISIGQGTIVASGSKELVIKQNTDKLGINWQSFNVGADGRVVFEQPNANSVALNRVVGSDGSSILGKIDANGQVFLVNPNGVMFGKNAQVNVGGLVASTLDITDKNFEDGNYAFERNGAKGAVINQGTLKATSGGYVALIGKNVKNQGLIQATLGTAAMAAGDSVTLDMSGDGLINLQVKKAAVGALLDNQGVIIADGGQALMTARAANALTETVINNDGVIQAQTINNKAGKIFLDGGPVDGQGTLTVGGTLDASAPVSGDGGFIDTSAKNVVIKESVKVTTAAKNGKFGTWLIDPTDFNISYGSGAQTTSSIGSLTLQTALASSNVSIATSAAGTAQGNIGLYNTDLTWSANTVLTLTAHNNIVLNSYAINVNGANGGLVLNYAGSLVLNGANAKINLNGASSTFAQNGVNYTVVRNLTDLQNVQSDLNGNYAIGVDFSAAASSSMNGGLGFNPLGDATTHFTGEIQGLGHTITGLYINRPTTDYVGLIGYADGAKLMDLKLSGANVTGRSYVGGVAGYFANSNSVRSTSLGNVSGVNYVGGLYGYGDASSTISFDISGATVTASGDNAGGIAGYYGGMGYYLTSTGPVSGYDAVGGVFGSASGTLHDSYSTSNISGHAKVGGLVGYASALNLYNAYSRGAVSGSLATGGLVGRAAASTAISTSFSYSPVTGNGGLVGELDSSSLTNTYAVGDVVGGSGAGLVGSSVNSTIDKSYATGKATYGLVGSATTSTITNSFWDMGTSGTTLSNGGTGKTSAQMKQAATFAGWSLDSEQDDDLSWRIYEGHTGPLLTFMMTDVNIQGFRTTYNGSNQVLNASTPITVSSSHPFWSKSGVSIALPNIEFTSGGSAIRNAGTYDISETPIYSNQFGWNITMVSTDLDVAKLTLSATTTLAKLQKTYDGTNSLRDDLYTASNIIAGDDVSIITPDAVYSTKNAGSGIRIDYGVSQLLGADAANYELSYGMRTGTDYTFAGVILKRAVTLGAAGIDKTYDGTTAGSVNLTFGGLIGSDSVTGSAASTVFSDKNAGANKTLTASGITLSGADAANYTVATSISTTATINKANLVVTAVGSDKTYDGTTSAILGSLTTDKLAGDTVTISGGTAAFADKNAGAGKTVTVSGYTVSGADAGNYTWNTSVSTTADISKAVLTISASGVDKTYDGNSNAQVSLTDDRIGGDDLVVSAGDAQFDDKNAGLGKVVTASGITVTGADANNYTWINTAVTTADINKAVLNVSATASNKTYDGTKTVSTVISDDRIGVDDLIISASSEFADKNAGAGKVVTVNGITVTGADADNYTWNASATTTADIAKAHLDITSSAADRTYDGTNQASASLSDNRIAGDDLNLGFSQADFTDKNAGSNKTVTVKDITVTGADAGNYEWDTTSTTTADIAKAVLSITANGVDKTYDGSTTANATLSDDRIGADDLTVSAGGIQFADKNAGTGKQVTVSGIVVSGVDAANYTWDASVLTSADINKAVLNVSATASDKTYDGTKNVSASISDDRIGIDDLTIAVNAEFADKNAGADKLVNVDSITVTGADAGNYTWNTSTTATADIAKAHLDITSSASDRTYDGTTQASASLSDNRISGDDLNLGFSQADFADKNSGTNKLVTVSGINVTGADAGNYDWNVTATTNADISKANLNVTASGVNKTYDASTAASATLADDRILGDALSISYGSAAYADKNAGTNKVVTVNGISVTGADAGNYTWNTSDVTHADIAKASLSITAAGVNKTYDGSTAGSSILSDNRFAGDDVVASAASSTFADKNAGVGKAVSVNGITVAGVDAANYTWNTTANTTANIDKANLNISATAQNKVYDATTSATVGYSDNRVLGDDLSISGVGTFSDKNAGSGKTVSVGGIVVTGADAQNYAWNTTTTAAADIAKATLTIGATGVNRVYDGSTNASVVLGDDRIVGDDLNIAYTASFSDKNAGTGKAVTASGITVTGADAGNYVWNTSTATTANITKAALTISAVAGNKVYDGNTSASATLSDDRIAGDDLTIGSSASFSDKNAGNGKLVTVGGITLGGADAGNYTWNASTTSTADITKANLVVSANGINKVYNGSTAADVTLSDNRVAGDDLILGSTASFSDKNAGSGKVVTASGITISGADANNYTWNTTATTTADIAKASLSISASGIDKTYDGNAAASVNFADDRISGDDLAIAGTAQFSDKNAGNNKVITVGGIALSGADAGNYTWNASTLATANIAKAVLDISAVAANKTYDGTTVASVALSDDRIAGDNLVIDAAAHFSDKNAGQGKVVTVDGISLSGADAQNYTFNSTTTASADIAKAALTISATGVDRTYDGSTKADVLLGDNRVSGDDISIDYTASFGNKNAGLNKAVVANGFVVTGDDAGNYTWNASATTTADIAKANLAIGATGVDRVYNGATDADVTLSDDRISGDDLSLGYTANFSDKNAGLNKDVLVYGINVTGADAANYVWNTTAATKADIAKATLNIAAAGANKTYDGNTSASVAFSDDRVLGDDLVISGAAAFSDKQAGNGKAVSVTGITLGGADAANYDWNTSASTIANIDKAALNVSAIAADKTYDGTTNASVTLGDNRVVGDDLVIGSSASFGDKNAGNGKLITVNGIVLSGADANNYTFNTSTTATANINKASLTIGATGVDRVYNGSTNASVVLGDDRIAGDDLNLGYTASFSDKNAGNGKAVLAFGITVSGADAGNYTWNTTASTTANIAKAALTVSGTVQDKVYDGSTQGSVGVLTDNRIAGDNLVISAAGATFADKNAGSKAAGIHGIDVQGADAGNYEWNSVSTTVAEITKAFLNLAATGSNKTYDGSTAASVTLSDDRVTGDDLQLSFDSAQFADKNAGASKAITVSGITLTGEDAGNYTVSTSVVGQADIAKANLTVSASQQTKKQNAADPVLDWKVTQGSLFGSDSITGSLGRAPGESVGSYAINQGTLTAGGNYNLTFAPGLLNIEVSKPAAVTEVVADITGTKMQAAKLESGNNASVADYRLLNLGMKLPADEVFAPVDLLLTEEQKR